MLVDYVAELPSIAAAESALQLLSKGNFGPQFQKALSEELKTCGCPAAGWTVLTAEHLSA